MAMVDFRGSVSYQFPSRKPLSTPHVPGSGANEHTSRIAPDLEYSMSSYKGLTSVTVANAARKSHIPASSTSSPYFVSTNTARRTPSTSTTSTSNTTHVPTRTPSTISTTLSRTASSRSGASITTSSYVALMRKQKATVWCDRAQHEDPRILAQQKAAKMRATREVSGGNMEGRSSTGSMTSGTASGRGKIRHHGLPKSSGYNYANLAGEGVPIRLSTTEVGDEEDGQDDADGFRNGAHHRSDSGRSSIGSNKWLANATQKQSIRYSQGSLRASGQESSSNEDIPELEETPMPKDYQKHRGTDYFFHPSGEEGSGDSSEMEANFGNVGQMNGPTTARDLSSRAEDLRRRGSVDERSNTMGGLGGGRLFVANP